MLRICTVLLASAMFAAPAFAALHDHAGHGGHGSKSAVTITTRTAKPATKAYRAAMDRMHAGMDIPYTGDADADFVRGMVPHHQGAVEMANIQLQYGKDEELKKLTRWIIQQQELEIGQMQQWMKVRGYEGQLHVGRPTLATEEFRRAMDRMHEGMNIRYTGDADVDFVRGMIPHHQGAVDMALILKRRGSNMAINKLADDIIRSQQQEIAQMQEWLDKRGQR